MWIRIGEGSIPVTGVVEIVCNMLFRGGVSGAACDTVAEFAGGLDWTGTEIIGRSCCITDKMVCKGSSGSHDSIHADVGSKAPVPEKVEPE